MSAIIAIARNDLACYVKKRAPLFWTFIGPAACMWLFGSLTPSFATLAPVAVVNHNSHGLSRVLVHALRRDGHQVTEIAETPSSGLSVEITNQPAVIVHASAIQTTEERSLSYEVKAALMSTPVELPVQRPSSGGFQRTVPAYLIMFLTMNLLVSGAGFAEERANGRLRRLLIAPISALQIICGRLGSRLVIAWFQMIFLLSIGVFLLRITWAQHPLSLLFVLSLYTVAMGGIGILLGTAFRDPDQAQTFAMWLALLIAPLTGLWWPIELMPKPIASLAQFLPTGWIMRCVNSMLADGTGLQQFWLTAIGLMAVAALSIGIASKRLSAW